jgi:hypothetical protein
MSTRDGRTFFLLAGFGVAAGSSFWVKRGLNNSCAASQGASDSKKIKLRAYQVGARGVIHSRLFTNRRENSHSHRLHYHPNAGEGCPVSKQIEAVLMSMSRPAVARPGRRQLLEVDFPDCRMPWRLLQIGWAQAHKSHSDTAPWPLRPSLVDTSGIAIPAPSYD